MKRDYHVQFRLSLLEKKTLEKRASEAGLSVSAFIRQITFGHEIKQPLCPEALQAYQDIGRLATGLTRLSNLLKAKEDKALREANIQLGKELRILMLKLIDN